jgi:lambda family phage portal protein
MGFFDRFTKEKKAPAAAMQRRNFNAARMDRFTASWFSGTNSINKELEGDLDKLRSRGRDLSKNNEYGKKFQNMVIANVIGPNGFKLQSRTMTNNGTPDKLDNDAIELAFGLWAKRGVCDITGKLSFNDACRMLVAGMPSDGEFLVRMIRGKDAANEFGFALQFIDIDRLDTQFNREVTQTSNAVVMGVEVNRYLRPVAYHIFSAHPSISGSRKRERVLAEDMIHGFISERAEQVRGVPWMSPSILTLHHLGKFEESAMLAARNGADNLGFFVTVDGSAEALGDGNGESSGYDESIKVSVPGSYDVLPEGVDYRQHDSKYPDTMIDSFIKNFLRRAASGFNVSYNGFANDLEGVNFSSIRAGVIEERDQWMTLQNWFADSFLTVIFSEWLKSALLNNAIKSKNGMPLPASRLSKFQPHHWQGRRWQWVDPAKDIKAARDAVKSGVLSPQMIAAQQGVSIEDVIDDIKRFEEMTADLQSISYDEKPVKENTTNQDAPTDQNEGDAS